jgi:glycosyltransferase involved in cell wall biosynthesis
MSSLGVPRAIAVIRCDGLLLSMVMQLSVVIPARNEEARLGAQLDALLSQDWDGDWDIIIVDNGSTDGTAELVHRYAEQWPRVRYLLADGVADQSFAANAGVAATDADAVAFCDGDDIVVAGWLAAIADGLESHDVVTGPNELDLLNPPWLATSRGASGDNSVGSFAGIFPLVRGNNYGVRREVWKITGPLKESFFPVADQEFSLRCWLNGIEIVGLPDAIVHYRYRDTASVLWRQGFAYGSHRPWIARLLKDAGKPTPPKFAGWKSWVMLIVKAPTAVTRHGRATWIWIAANRLGQVVGSIRHRIVML